MKVGDYVRTKDGYICKIININEFREPSMKYGVEASYLKDIMFIGDEDIFKSLPNVIDLIEGGDYVNGYKVSFVDEEPVMGKFVQCDYEVSFGATNHYRFYKADIKSIVTKEQFSSMEYKI